jgi:2-phospho-L-lactate guanylyltransferase
MTLPCAVLVVPADIPLLRAGLIAAAASHLSKPRSVVLAPAWRDGGTNLMGCNPAGLIAPSFGPDSFARHCRLAEKAGCKPLILRDQRLARDIDTIADLTDLPADRLGSRTLRYLDSVRRTIDSSVLGRAS